MTSANDIRKAFIDHFSSDCHEHVPSSPLLPVNDPTLMFVNSGMVQFKNVFIGAEQRPYNRAVTTQKCLRAGGKHNDLDNVGYTTRHHTFFEMLGNFSFGDYFKEHAIDRAWDLITKGFELPKERLLVTVHSDDEEAASLWRKIAGLPDSKIIRINTSDNFWQMGDIGPCGPCSEIFYDHGDTIWGGPPGSAEEDGDRFVEIWNLVFMQFEQITLHERINLPNPSIDTGMGLERIAAILQGKHDNYDIDLMRALIITVANLTGVDPDGEQKSSHRVIADHLRASCFLIADGVLPSNEGRGYVLRRIMRRAMRHGQLLGANEPLMHKLVPHLIGQMGEAFPELLTAKALMTETLLLEEERFRRTLARGLVLLDEEVNKLDHHNTLSGETAFKLYDTYGFPLDLTEDALRSRNINVDTDAFNRAMERQKAEARAAWSGSGDQGEARFWFELRDHIGNTEFIGYEYETSEAEVLAIIVDGACVDTLSEGQQGWMILNQSCFYGEAGGQVGDQGEALGDNIQINISDVKRQADGALLAHKIAIKSGTLKVGSQLKLNLDHERRHAIRRNHSATHLIHEALRQTLGDHVAQKGSLVTPERLRFDFSHHKPVSQEELSRIIQITNRMVLQNNLVSTRIMLLDEARQSGARALFGEKYGDEVRVVSMGTNSDNSAYSIELCGGTHVAQTGEIGMVFIASEQAVASGVRRIEAVSGQTALNHAYDQQEIIAEALRTLKTTPQEMNNKINRMAEDVKNLSRENSEMKRKLALVGDGTSNKADIKHLGDIQFMARLVENIPSRDLKAMVDSARDNLEKGVMAFISCDSSGKANIVIGVTNNLSERISAITLVRIAGEILGGKGGGGRPDLAQAGGSEGHKAQQAFEALEAYLGKQNEPSH